MIYFATGLNLLHIQEIRVYGAGLIDNITLSNAPQSYESGTGTGNWTTTGSGLSVATGTDADTGSAAIQLSGVSNRTAGAYFTRTLNDSQRFDMAWDLKTTMAYYVIVNVTTDDGIAYTLRYDPSARDYRNTVSNDIQIGLGSDSTDGKWRTFRRNLADDLFQGAGVNIATVNSINVYASGSVDNVLLWGNGIRTSGR